MSRFASGISLACILGAIVLLSACSSGNTTTVIVEPTPATIDLCLAPASTCAAGLNVSLEVGKTQGLTATGKNGSGQALTETFSFQSSNPAVLTIASNGDACAGTWNSLTVPQVCTPGPTGVAQVTATAKGVSSPPVTIYVHQHITGVTISKVPNQPATLSTTCFSKGAPSGPESAFYQAFALYGTTDITNSVGPFAWQTVLLAGQTTSAVTLSSPPVGSPLNQEIATANTPGLSLFFTSVGGIHSQPVPFETCPVQSISISALNNPTTSFVVNTGTSTTLNATVTDILGMSLVGVPLTWNSTDPISASATGGANSTIYGSVGTVSASAIGGAAVIASCTPPSCNGGISPSLPIYPKTAISFTVTSTSKPASPTVYVSSTGCSATAAPCGATVVPLTRSSTSSTFTAGSPVSLPFTPNSMVFDDTGTNSYLGVDSSSFGTRSVMAFAGASASTITNVAGKVLAISPDTSTAIISDTIDVPNQVFICTNCSSTTSHTVASFLINNATAASFSPDSLKAYIVAGSNLYVYSKTDPLQKISLPAPATDAAFIGEGSFGYLAGGDPAGASFFPTCYDPALSLPLGSLSLASQMIRALPDGQSALALAPPNIQTVTATISGAPVLNVPGCPAPRGFLTISNAVGPSINLGIGNFTPTQFIISPDGSTAYILAQVLPSQRTVINISAASQSTSNTTYSYTLTSGSALQVGMSIDITGMQNVSDNGTFVITAVNPASGSNPGTFTVVNASGINAIGENGTGTVTPRFPFVTVFNLNSQTSSNISLNGNATPLSASLSPAGDLLFVGADDAAVHVIDTASFADIQQITFPFSQNALCFGPGTPATAPPVTCLPDLVTVKP